MIEGREIVLGQHNEKGDSLRAALFHFYFFIDLNY